MSQSNASPGVPTQASPSSRYPADEPTAWVGLVVFAGVILLMVGAFHAIAGFVGLFREQLYVVPGSDLVVAIDYTVWGWVHLLLGLLAVAAGGGLLSGQTWARVVGVLFALVSAVANFAFFPAYPWWSGLMIALDVLIVYALVAHGREVQQR